MVVDATWRDRERNICFKNYANLQSYKKDPGMVLAVRETALIDKRQKV